MQNLNEEKFCIVAYEMGMFTLSDDKRNGCGWHFVYKFRHLYSYHSAKLK